MLNDQPFVPPFNGGAAFPCTDWPAPGHEGMSLRDWFAGMALPTMISLHYHARDDDETPAQRAYAMADAMLRVRADAK